MTLHTADDSPAPRGPRDELLEAARMLREQAEVMAATCDPQDFEESVESAQEALDRLRAMS